MQNRIAYVYEREYSQMLSYELGKGGCFAYPENMSKRLIFED